MFFFLKSAFLCQYLIKEKEKNPERRHFIRTACQFSPLFCSQKPTKSSLLEIWDINSQVCHHFIQKYISPAAWHPFKVASLNLTCVCRFPECLNGSEQHDGRWQACTFGITNGQNSRFSGPPNPVSGTSPTQTPLSEPSLPHLKNPPHLGLDNRKWRKKKKKKTRISRGGSGHGESDGRGPGRRVVEDDSSVSASLLHQFPLLADSCVSSGRRLGLDLLRHLLGTVVGQTQAHDGQHHRYLVDSAVLRLHLHLTGYLSLQGGDRRRRRG